MSLASTRDHLRSPVLRRLAQLARLLLGCSLAAAVILTALIVFGTRPPPPPMRWVNDNAIRAAQSRPLAPISWFTARDGTRLAYRAYPAAVADPALVAVLIHGSGGSSTNMNVLGHALSNAGVPAFAPDIRGQGLSGRRGDIDYIGQQEDDLADLIQIVRGRHPGAQLVLAGHSSGGGFALRVAGDPVGRAFSRFVLLAPNLGHNAVSTRPTAGGWVSAYTPRIIGLKLLNKMGITAFNDLPVLAFALPPMGPHSTHTRYWSYRMMVNFGPRGEVSLTPGAYKADAVRAPGPVIVLAGELDESFYAERYALAFADVRPHVAVRVVPGVSHMGIVSEPTALPEVVAAIRGADTSVRATH